MAWRLAAMLITGFWVAMTTLLVRVTYYPEGSQFAKVPPSSILKLYLDRGASGKQLHLYRGDVKIGHATVDLRRTRPERDLDDFTLMLSGVLERGAVPDLPGAFSWRVTVDLKEGRRWAGASGQMRLPDDSIVLDFRWEEGRLTPEFTLKKAGVVTADDKLIQPLLGQVGAGGAPGGLPGVSPSGTAPDDSVRVAAREGVVKIAGQSRRGYVLTVALMERSRVSAFFTGEGDLALIELPNGYRALEPNIHGLVPDEPDEES